MSADFAEQAFRDWTTKEDQRQADTSNDSIHMPDAGNDSLDEAHDFVVRNWSIPGDVDAGETLPPATSPVTSPGVQDVTDSAKRLTLENLPKSPVLMRARSRTSSTSSSHSAHVAMAMAASWRGETISPPDPSLLTATSADEPLGHGVSSDTTVRDDGLLERQIDGKKILVPQDEIASAAVHRRNSIGSAGGG
jgi:SIT4-associating protein SAP185/190